MDHTRLSAAKEQLLGMLPAVRRSFGFGLVVLVLVAGQVAARQQAPPPAASGSGAISGVVTDGATGKPIPGATVLVAAVGALSFLL